MFLKKAERDGEKRDIQFEQQAMFFGDLQAVIANTQRNSKKNPTAFTRHDFYKFSIFKKQEKVKKISTRLTPDEVEKLVNGK